MPQHFSWKNSTIIFKPILLTFFPISHSEYLTHSSYIDKVALVVWYSVSHNSSKPSCNFFGNLLFMYAWLMLTKTNCITINTTKRTANWNVQKNLYKRIMSKILRKISSLRKLTFSYALIWQQQHHKQPYWRLLLPKLWSLSRPILHHDQILNPQYSETAIFHTMLAGFLKAKIYLKYRFYHFYLSNIFNDI